MQPCRVCSGRAEADRSGGCRRAERGGDKLTFLSLKLTFLSLQLRFLLRISERAGAAGLHGDRDGQRDGAGEQVLLMHGLMACTVCHAPYGNFSSLCSSAMAAMHRMGFQRARHLTAPQPPTVNHQSLAVRSIR
jgi:tRNA U54 and U55 pseudouridine synthase Pus10